MNSSQRLVLLRTAHLSARLFAVALCFVVQGGCAEDEDGHARAAHALVQADADSAGPIGSATPPLAAEGDLVDPDLHGGVSLDRFTVVACRGATAHQVTMAPDRRSVVVRFFGMVLEGASASAGCTLSLRATPPPGFRLALASFDVEGAFVLPAGAAGVLTASPSFLGRAHTAIDHRLTYPGPREGPFTARFTTADDDLRFERCGSEVFSVPIGAALTNPQSGAATSAVERVHSVRFKLARCSS